MSLGIFLGIAADRLLGDPGGKWHPVALFGRYASWLETHLYQPNRRAGIIYVAGCVIPPVAASIVAHRRWPQASTAVALYWALGGTTLERIGNTMALALERGDKEVARALVPWLCSRDPQLLDETGMARAAVESLAENTSDAAIAPLVWASLGAPGVVLHRAVNTLDAMVGYRNEKYAQFGWAAATLDDVLAFVPARVTAVTHVAIAATKGRFRAAIRAWVEDAPHHPSPNAGPVEATAAAALGVQLGGPTVYAHGIEQRPILGQGPRPSFSTIHDAVRLSRTTQLIVAAGVIAVSFARRRLR